MAVHGHEPIPLRVPVAALMIGSRGNEGAVDRLARHTGVERLRDDVLGILPSAGNGAIFDAAVRLGTAILRQAATTEEESAVLVFPAEADIRDGEVTLVSDQLERDLARRPPQFASAGLFVTGYVSRWLEGSYELTNEKQYRGPSGRPLPLLRVVSERQSVVPWHNPQPLGRNVEVVREWLDRNLDRRNESALFLEGQIGVGKSYAAWRAFEGEAERPIWIDLGRSLSGSPVAAKSLASELLSRGCGDSCPIERQALPGLAELGVDQCANLLGEWINGARRAGSSIPGVVYDRSEWAAPADRALVRQMLSCAGELGPCRQLAVGRGGRSGFDVPTVRLGGWASGEIESFREQLLEGLGVPDDVSREWLNEAGGSPLAFEETLFEAIRKGELRRVYGSFFYAGESRERGRPSKRLIAYMEAEIQRLGATFPLRTLAVAGCAVGDEIVRDIASRFEYELDPGWSRPFVDNGLLEVDVRARLSFASPALASAVAATIESPEVLSHEVGMALVRAESGWKQQWSAYQLLSATDEAVPVLIDLTRKRHPSTHDPELFERMVKSFRLLRTRVGIDDTADLLARELLWAMLPIARRTGRLSQLEGELLELIEAESGSRKTALIGLKSDLDLEQGRFGEAERGLVDGLAQSAGEPLETRARLLIGLGKLAQQRGRYREARRVFSDLIALLGADWGLLRATCLYHLAEVDLAENALEDAARRHAEARELRKGDPSAGRVLVQSMTALGNVALVAGDYPEALAWFRRSIASARDLEVDAELAEALRGEGRVLGRLGDHHTATKALREASTILTTRDDRTALAITGLYLAQNRFRLGSLSAAIGDARRAHFQLSLMPEGVWRGHSSQMLGSLLFQHEEYREAGEYFDAAVGIYVRFGAWPEVAVVRSMILDVARATENESLVVETSRMLLDRVEDHEVLPYGELIFYRLFRAFEWLQARGEVVPTPSRYLERAYSELLRKTAFLEPGFRHIFLFRIAEHQAIVDAAAELQLQMPV